MKAVNIKKVTPLFTGIITTAELCEVDTTKSGIITKSSNIISEFQKVIAVGDCVRNIKVGDFIKIDYRNYIKNTYEKGSIKNEIEEYKKSPVYSLPKVDIDGVEYLYIQDRDVVMIIDDFEFVDFDVVDKKRTIMTEQDLKTPITSLIGVDC